MLATLAFLASPASAEKSASVTKKPDRPAASTAKATEIEKDVLHFDPLTIEVEIQRPEAIRLLRQSTPTFEDGLPPESFIPKIFESVESSPF